VGGTLNNCALRGNGAEFFGGGASGGTLNNCTITGNTATNILGGGAHMSTLDNCIVWGDTAGQQGSNYYYVTINSCCTAPRPDTGVGNITNAPLFVNLAGGNLRLQSGSPCINAGTNYFAPSGTDLEGRLRIVSGAVDMGAYEFQGPFNQWLQKYGLPTDGWADFVDTDGDGHNNWQEWRCLTCPTNASSVLRLLSASAAGPNVAVTWQTLAGVNYFLERSANLACLFILMATNVTGQAGVTTYADTNATGAGPFFYRVGVQSP
jgi:hypothetical protein